MHTCIYIPKEKIQPFYLDAAAEYIKRLGRYGKCATKIYTSSARLAAQLPAAQQKIKIIGVHSQGKLLSSEALAADMSQWATAGYCQMVFLLGDLPFPADVAESWAITALPLPIGLAYVLLLEQIYRGYRIQHNEPYHK